MLKKDHWPSDTNNYQVYDLFNCKQVNPFQLVELMNLEIQLSHWHNNDHLLYKLKLVGAIKDNCLKMKINMNTVQNLKNNYKIEMTQQHQ